MVRLSRDTKLKPRMPTPLAPRPSGEVVLNEDAVFMVQKSRGEPSRPIRFWVPESIEARARAIFDHRRIGDRDATAQALTLAEVWKAMFYVGLQIMERATWKPGLLGVLSDLKQASGDILRVAQIKLILAELGEQMEWLESNARSSGDGTFRRIQCKKIEGVIAAIDEIIADPDQPDASRAAAMVARRQVDDRFGHILKRARVKLRPAPEVKLDLGHDESVVELMAELDRDYDVGMDVGAGAGPGSGVAGKEVSSRNGSTRRTG